MKPLTRKAFIIIFCILLSAFALLSKYEDRQALRSFDFSVTVRLQHVVNSTTHLRLASIVDTVMEGATFFATPGFTIFVTIILWSLLVYSHKIKKWQIRAFMIPVALLLLVLTEVYGKSVVAHPSPPFVMVKNPTTLFPKDYINEQFSFPSGHAARAVFLAIVTIITMQQYNNITMRKRWIIGAGLVAYVLLVSVSRIYLGHHWFSDVVGGVLLGGAWGAIGAAALW